MQNIIDNTTNPLRSITLAAAASAALAAQGQFQAFDDSTRIVDATDATNAAGAFRLRVKLAKRDGAVDLTSKLLYLFVTPAIGNFTATINSSIGTVRQTYPATGGGMVVIQPDANGKVDVTIALSGGAGTVAHLIIQHRQFVSAGEDVTSAAA